MVWLKFRVGDRDYRITLDRLSIAEAREVKRYTGVTLQSLIMIAAGQIDGDVLAALVFLAKRRAGEDVDWDEIDQIDVLELAQSMTSADSDEPGESPPAATTANGKATPDEMTEPATT